MRLTPVCLVFLSVVVIPTLHHTIYEQLQDIPQVGLGKVAASGDGQFLAIATIGDVHIFKSENGRYSKIQTPNLKETLISFITMSRDGRFVIVGASGKVLILQVSENKAEVTQSIDIGKELKNGKIEGEQKRIVIETEDGEILEFALSAFEFNLEKKLISQLRRESPQTPEDEDNEIILLSAERQVLENPSQFQQTEDKKYLVIQSDSNTITLFRKQNPFMIHQETDSQGLYWEWIMIIVVSCFLVVMFLVIILYEFVCKPQVAGRREEKNSDEKKDVKQPEERRDSEEKMNTQEPMKENKKASEFNDQGYVSSKNLREDSLKDVI